MPIPLGAPVPASVTAHWEAVGSLASVAREAAEKRAQLMPDKEPTSCDRCQYNESLVKARDDTISKLNSLVDDQAAQIVDLKAKLALQSPTSFSDQVTLRQTVKRLQEIDATQRRNVERAEARAAQLESWAREHELDVPAEILRFRGTPGLL